MIRTGIIIAVKDEAKAILSDHRYGWKDTGGSHYVSTKFPLELVITGIGKAFASFGLSKISENADRIISMGTSGGLSDEKVGDLYIITEFAEHDMDVTGLGVLPGITPFSGMNSPIITPSSDALVLSLENAVQSAGFLWKKGRTISGDLFLCDKKVTDAKRDLFKADLTDMESAAIAKLCTMTIQKDMAAIRFVTDNANHEASVNWQENVRTSSSYFNKILYALMNEISA